MASLSSYRRLVVKIGSTLLVDRETGALRSDWLRGLVEDVAAAKGRGQDVAIVSSGSIALGREALQLPKGPLTLEGAQAAAAVGQIRLARAYEDALNVHGITAAQVLVTLDDSRNRRRYLNSRATLEHLLGLGVVPIVNENDTIATDEIRYGDNDRLAAQIAVTVGADLVVLLSDVDGLYSANPQLDPDARHIPLVDHITPEIEASAGDAGSGLSKGGMKTKVMAARAATVGGAALVITHGAGLRPLKALEDGARATWFSAQDDPQLARKRWIQAMKPEGRLIIDAGAAQALQQGKSLLPVGLAAVAGSFERGDPVAIETASGRELAIGLTRYSAQEAALIKGENSAQIEDLLGYPGRGVLVHRDDMAIKR